MSILDIARPDLRGLQAYSSARSEAPVDSMVLLNANESPWPSSVDPGLGLNRYPLPQPPELIAALARRFGVEPARVLATAGSDAGIDLIVRAFCRAGQDGVLDCPPTFGMFAVAAQIQGAALLRQPLEADFRLDFDALAARVEDAEPERPVRVVFLCSPNNPTGNTLPTADVVALCERLRERALVVVDEAYGEFSRQPGVLAELGNLENLAVLRTLSKAYALAGVRLGCVLAHPDVIDLLRRIMPPYPLPAPTVSAAIGALSPERLPGVAARIAAIQETRQWLAARLSGYGFVETVWPSDANFILVRVGDGAGLTDFARHRGVLIRDFSQREELRGCVRISVGSAPEMARLTAVLDEYEAGS